MNEQDMMLRKKIEKREKTDIIIAYILIGVLLLCIVLVLVLKFTKKEDEVIIDEYTPNYIGLGDISTSLNSSLLVNSYVNDGATFYSSVSGGSLVVTYTKDDNVINLNIPVVGNELVVTIPSDNTEIVTDIYKEITSIICVYYGNDENNCRNTVNNIDSNTSISGIRIEDDNVYIDITNSIDVNTEIVSTVNKTSIDSVNYNINLSDISITNVNVDISGDNVVFNGSIERLNLDGSSFSVIVKLYDVDGNILEQNSIDYSSDDLLEVDTFTIEFISETYEVDNVSDYSIEVVK